MGDSVGIGDGPSDGATDGIAVGASLGPSEGTIDMTTLGDSVVATTVLLGLTVDTLFILDVGDADTTDPEVLATVGRMEGGILITAGFWDGLEDDENGANDGDTVGALVGSRLGHTLGLTVGDHVGPRVGPAEGRSVATYVG